MFRTLQAGRCGRRMYKEIYDFAISRGIGSAGNTEKRDVAAYIELDRERAVKMNGSKKYYAPKPRSTLQFPLSVKNSNIYGRNVQETFREKRRRSNMKSGFHA